jgi:flagellar biosynthesis protein FlhF
MFEIYASPGESEGTNENRECEDRLSLGEVKSELLSIKKMLFHLSRSHHRVEDLLTSPDAINLYAKMVGNGIAESNAKAFLEKSGALDRREDVSAEILQERVLKEIIKVIDVTDPFDSAEGQTIAAFVGPTGVGKTTTVAKLMANFSLKHKKRVGLISIDNYRVGAVEQLKTYAGILGIPCFSAFTCSDLQVALRQLSQQDVILIDTAGQSHYDDQRMEELAGFISTHPSINCHLLLSTSINESEMFAAAQNFGRLDFDSYIFTKTDETQAKGVIINQLLKLKKPVSFVTNGQRVPEDIFKATRTNILSLMFQ